MSRRATMNSTSGGQYGEFNAKAGSRREAVIIERYRKRQAGASKERAAHGTTKHLQPK